MLKEESDIPVTAQARAIDLPLNDSVALRRLVEEVRQSERNPQLGLTAYNRTYHRHNR